MYARIDMDNVMRETEARYQASSLSIKLDGYVELYHDSVFVAAYEKGNHIKGAMAKERNSNEHTECFANAARVLLYGNGDTSEQIQDLALCLERDDGVAANSRSRLLRILDELTPAQRTFYAGEEWNK